MTLTQFTQKSNVCHYLFTHILFQTCMQEDILKNVLHSFSHSGLEQQPILCFRFVSQICCIKGSRHHQMHTVIIYNNIFRFGCQVLQRAKLLKSTPEPTQMTFIQMRGMDQWNCWPQITWLIYSNWVDTQIHMHRDIKGSWKQNRFTPRSSLIL